MKKFYIFLLMFLGVVGGGIFGVANSVIAVDSESLGDEAAGDEAAGDEAAGDEAAGLDLPEIFIKSINPGYTVDGVSNVGEMIEIGRKNSDDLFSLAGINIGYQNSSGSSTILVDLSKYTWVAGETINLQLASSPGSEQAQVRYSKTLAFKAGPLTIERDGEIIDSVCWTGAAGCFKPFSSSYPTSLVRNLETGDFESLTDYKPGEGGVLIENDDSSSQKETETVEPVNTCRGVMFSEILSYYESLQDEQFIELYNNSAFSVKLDGCFIKYKNKKYPLAGSVDAEGYFVRLVSDFKLTKNPTISNTLELVDSDGSILDKLTYYNGQRKGTSYALVGYDADGSEIWKTTYAPTPGEANNYQEFRICEAGKVINEATGNCVKVSAPISEKVCKEGQYLNLLTGRCKKIPVSDNGAKTCREGYYLNEETGRCRKIKENKGADYAVVPETYSESSSFVGLYLVLGVVGVGLIYIIYEFRFEILKFVRRLKR